MDIEYISYMLLDSYLGLNDEDYNNGLSICDLEAENNSGFQQKY